MGMISVIVLIWHLARAELWTKLSKSELNQCSENVSAYALDWHTLQWNVNGIGMNHNLND